MLREAVKALKHLEEAQGLWEQAVASLPDPENMQGMGISAAELSREINEIVMQVSSISQEIKFDQLAWHSKKGELYSAATAFSEFMRNNHANPAAINDNASSICTWLWRVKESARFVIPTSEMNLSKNDIDDEAASRLSVLREMANRSDLIYRQIQDGSKLVGESLKAIEKIKIDITSLSEEIAQKKSVIDGHEREANTAKTNTEASAVKAVSEAEKAQQLINQLTEKSTKIEADITLSEKRKNELFGFFEDKKIEIVGLLENANKVGLAKSFQDKRKSLQRAEWFWVACFAIGIIFLFCTGKGIVKEMSADADLVLLSLKILASGPLIWGTWFSARQYSHALKMAEDYAFKEAAAMAYAGYRNEVAADPEMLKLLQKSAISSYAENPAKILLGDTEPASPIHEAMNKAIEKVNPDKLVDLIKEILGKK